MTRSVPPRPGAAYARVCRHPVSKSETACLNVREGMRPVCLTTEAHRSPAALALHLLWSLATMAMRHEHNKLGIMLKAKPDKFLTIRGSEDGDDQRPLVQERSALLPICRHLHGREWGRNRRLPGADAPPGFLARARCHRHLADAVPDLTPARRWL